MTYKDTIDVIFLTCYYNINQIIDEDVKILHGEDNYNVYMNIISTRTTVGIIYDKINSISTVAVKKGEDVTTKKIKIKLYDNGLPKIRL